jgi:uncharacterized protein YkwD
VKRSFALLVLVWIVTSAAGCARPSVVATQPPGPTAYLSSTPVATRAPTSTPTRRATATLVPSLTPRPSRTPTPEPDLAVLARYMAELVNRDRVAVGLEPVEWDDTAAVAAREHAEEMALHGYLSHWNLRGYGPEHRYAFAGGRDAVQENVYSYYQRYATGEGMPIRDWYSAVETAQQSFMSSPAHQDNILLPAHTHVGIGIAYDRARGELRIAQEFLNRYVVLEPVPEAIRPGDAIQIAGRVLPGASTPLINLAYEPFPAPRTVEELNATSAYESAASAFLAVSPNVNGDRFWATIPFTASEKPGLYHVRVWVSQSGEQVLAGNLILRLDQ